MSDCVNHRVLLFAQLAEEIGHRELTLPMPAGATVAEALDALAEAHEPIRVLRELVAIAVNERYARPEDVLPVDADIALIPPVSGG